MTTFLDLPVECQLMVKEFYEASLREDVRKRYKKVLEQLTHYSFEVNTKVSTYDDDNYYKNNIRIDHNVGMHFFYDMAVPIIYLTNSPRKFWARVRGPIAKRKIHFLNERSEHFPSKQSSYSQA